MREPRPGARHGWLAADLIRRLGSYADERGLGIVATETGFLLSVDPPTVRGPDVAFIAAANIPAPGIPAGWWTKAPDLAIEILSPSNRAGEIQEKALEYLEGGTRLVWVVDPDSRSVVVYGPRESATRLLSEGDTLDGADVLPGFSLPLVELFRPYKPATN